MVILWDSKVHTFAQIFASFVCLDKTRHDLLLQGTWRVKHVLQYSSGTMDVGKSLRSTAMCANDVRWVDPSTARIGQLRNRHQFQLKKYVLSRWTTHSRLGYTFHSWLRYCTTIAPDRDPDPRHSENSQPREAQNIL